MGTYCGQLIVKEYLIVLECEKCKLYDNSKEGC